MSHSDEEAWELSDCEGGKPASRSEREEATGFVTGTESEKPARRERFLLFVSRLFSFSPLVTGFQGAFECSFPGETITAVTTKHSEPLNKNVILTNYDNYNE